MAKEKHRPRGGAATKGGAPAPKRKAHARAGGEDGRRHPRLRARCRVEVRDRYGTWQAETEDLGPRGCRIVTPRPQTVGAVVGLTVESDVLADRLEVTGQVVWTLRERPARAGISFAGAASVPGSPTPSAWFKALDAAERAARRPSRTPVPLVPPPPAGVDDRTDGDPASAAPADLARRLVGRARELVASGDAARAAVILRRALALVPGDADAEALLREAERAG